MPALTQQARIGADAGARNLWSADTSAFADIETAYGRYTAFLLAGDRNGCRTVVEELLVAGCPVKTLYQDIFQRALYHVGDLWEQNHISVAREHVATAITESLLSLVYPVISGAAATSPRKGRAVVACTALELHQLGARMVADLLEMNGWDCHFLGSGTPPDSLVYFIHEMQPDLLCLSLSVQMNLGLLVHTIRAVRMHFSTLPIIVGGQAFRWGGSEHLGEFPLVTYATGIEHLEELIVR